jgi:hypothetical protein
MAGSEGMMKRWYIRYPHLIPSIGIILSALATPIAGQLWAKGAPSFVFALAFLPFLASVAIFVRALRKMRKDVEALAKARYKVQVQYGTDPSE